MAKLVDRVTGWLKKSGPVYEQYVHVGNEDQLHEALNDDVKKIYVKPGEYTLDDNLQVPAGCSLCLGAGQYYFGDYATLYVFGNIENDGPVSLTCKDAMWRGIRSNYGTIAFDNVQVSRVSRSHIFEAVGGQISISEKCKFFENENAYIGLFDCKGVFAAHIMNNLGYHNLVQVKNSNINMQAHAYNNRDQYAVISWESSTGEILGHYHDNKSDFPGATIVVTGRTNLKIDAKVNDNSGNSGYGGGVVIEDDVVGTLSINEEKIKSNTPNETILDRR